MIPRFLEAYIVWKSTLSSKPSMEASSSPVILSCNDSPLSIASAIVSFLTFAYAILVGVAVYVQRAREVPEMLSKFLRDIEYSRKRDYQRLGAILGTAKSVLRDNSDWTTLNEQIYESVYKWQKHIQALEEIHRRIRHRRSEGKLEFAESLCGVSFISG